jgi:Zn-dependent protease with chaperone function
MQADTIRRVEALQWRAEQERRADRYAVALTAANDALAALPREDEQRYAVATGHLENAIAIIRGGLRAELNAENPFSGPEAA